MQESNAKFLSKFLTPEVLLLGCQRPGDIMVDVPCGSVKFSGVYAGLNDSKSFAVWGYGPNARVFPVTAKGLAEGRAYFAKLVLNLI